MIVAHVSWYNWLHQRFEANRTKPWHQCFSSPLSTRKFKEDVSKLARAGGVNRWTGGGRWIYQSTCFEQTSVDTGGINARATRELTHCTGQQWHGPSRKMRHILASCRHRGGSVRKPMPCEACGISVKSQDTIAVQKKECWQDLTSLCSQIRSL